MPEPTNAPLGTQAPADTFGVYRAVRPLGEGASGRVFLAERTDFAQRVALKVFHSAFLTAGLNNPSEQHLLASLDHRHIVRVLQQGTTPAGVRYLAMEYIDGPDIVSFCDTHRLPLPARVMLLLQVLDAVEHAHRHLVVHGDLKPANILVAVAAAQDAQAPHQPLGETKLVDFGAAVRLNLNPNNRLADEETTTAHTPVFASPEQRAGGRTTVASDVYSLGLLARLLLAGIPPGATPAELPSRLVSRGVADVPGELSSLAEARAATPAQLTVALRGDLDAILQKALQPRPDERYLTAGAMAADLRAFAEGRPIAARQTPLPERLRKWTVRHKLGAAMAAVLACALLFSAVGIAVQAAHARRSRREAEARLLELVQLTGTLQSELYGSVRPLPNAGASEKLLTDSAAAALDKLAAAGSRDSTLRSELAGQYEQLAQLEMEQAGFHPNTSAQPAPPAVLQHLQRALDFTPAKDAHHAERARLLQQAQQQR